MKTIPTKIFLLSCILAVLSSAQATDMYWGGGIADVADNTTLPTNVTLFAGTWNSATKNWASTNTPGVYGSFVNGSMVDLGLVTFTTEAAVSAITNQADASLSGLMLYAGASAGSNQKVYLTATSPRTLTLTGNSFLLNILGTDNNRGLQIETNVYLAGSAPLTSSGLSGRFIIKSNSTNYTGNVSLRNSNFVIDSSSGSSGWGSLAGVPRWNLRSQLLNQGNTYPRLYVYRPVASAFDQLKDNGTIALSYGYFYYKGLDHATSPSSETIGKLLLEPYGVLDLGAIGNGNVSTARPAIVLADATAGLDRGSSGVGTLTITVPTSLNTGVQIGVPASDVVVSNGVAPDVLLPWISTSMGEFMKLNSSTKVLERVPATIAPLDLGSWATGSDYRVVTSNAYSTTGTFSSNLSINSLGIYAMSNLTFNIDSGKTLNITSGALSQMEGVNNQIFIFTNGTLTSSSGTLYVHKSTSQYHGNLILASVISGSGMNLVKTGLGNVLLQGPDSNTYNGTTYVTGDLTANKTGSAVAVPGNLVIQAGGRFYANGTAPISSTSAVTIDEDGFWSSGIGNIVHGGTVTINGGCYYSQNYFNTFAAPGTGLVFTAGGRLFDWNGGPASFSIQTTVAYLSSSPRQARIERGRSDFSATVELDGAQRTFDIADSATLAANVPELVIDMPIVDGQTNGVAAKWGALRKIGSGILQVTDTNTYTGGTVIDGGTLHVATLNAPAQTNLTAGFTASPNLITFNQPVAKNMILRQRIGSASKTGFTDKRYVIEVLNDYQLVTDAVGAIGRPSDVYVEALSRSGSLGTAPVTVNATGTLKIDPGIFMTNAIVVNANGTINASGARIGSLAVTNGTVAVNVATGALVVSNNVSLSGAALTLTGTSSVTNDAIVILSSSTGITGRFSSIPDRTQIAYTPTSVILGKLRGLSIIVR